MILDYEIAANFVDDPTLVTGGGARAAIDVVSAGSQSGMKSVFDPMGPLEGLDNEVESLASAGGGLSLFSATSLQLDFSNPDDPLFGLQFTIESQAFAGTIDSVNIIPEPASIGVWGVMIAFASRSRRRRI